MTSCSSARQVLHALIMLLAAVTFDQAQGQFNYSFEALSGTFPALPIVASDLNSIEANNRHSVAIPLGFVFHYDGSNVTQVKVNSNGWLDLDVAGTDPNALQARSNNLANPHPNVLMSVHPLWDNLGGGGGQARYNTSGTAPNRVFTMEWGNWRWNNAAGTAVISFQCRLYESSDVIEFIYDQDAGAVTSASASIGLVGASVGRFISLNNTGPAPLASSTVATNNLNTKPAIGQIYRFTPCPPMMWYADADGDGFGDPNVDTLECNAPPGYVTDGTDDCPLDPLKNDPGNCGCGVPDTDSDGDLSYDCNDQCPNDPLKIAPGTCGCGVADVDSDGDLTADCNDLCPLDPNKIAPGNCGCGSPDPGESCNDGNAQTGNDVIQANCTCQGEVIDCLGVPGGSDLPGTACDDGDAGTSNDTWDASCTCTGSFTLCENSMVLQLTTDGNGDQTSWEILPQGGGTAVCAGPGTPPYASNATINENCCLPDGCYDLKVHDSFGDGMTIGHHVLRYQSGERVIDNLGNGNFGSVSQAPLGFCLPIGTARITPSRSDMSGVNPGEWMQATPDAAVSAQFGITNGTSGYQFWFFNPNGGYSRRVFISHAFNNHWFPAGPERASYMKLNCITTVPLPMNTPMNVRVRVRVAGAYGEFGAACRLSLGCSTTQLVDDIASPEHSCGLTGIELDNGQVLHAVAVNSANKYQWEFIRPGQSRLIATNGRTVPMNTWATDPLIPGGIYDVRVRVSFDAGLTWCPFGAVCKIQLADPIPLQGVGTHMATQENDILMLWPNPNRDGRMTLHLDGLGEGSHPVSVDVLDLLGARVMSERFNVDGELLNTVMTLNAGMHSGMYVVTVTVADRVFTERLVVQ